jgi:3'-5' exoribonuclease
LKNTYVKDIKYKERIESSFMILKILGREEGRIICFIGDNSGDIKCEIQDKGSTLQIGDVISIIGEKDALVKVYEFEKLKDFNINEYLPSVKRPVEDIMSEIEQLSKEEFKSEECLKLNDYF